jgi:hypothetical protein
VNSNLHCLNIVVRNVVACFRSGQVQRREEQQKPHENQTILSTEDILLEALAAKAAKVSELS